MEKLMDKELIIIVMDLNMKVLGKMIYMTEMEQEHGQMVQNIRDNLSKDRETEKVNLHGQMVQNI